VRRPAPLVAALFLIGATVPLEAQIPQAEFAARRAALAANVSDGVVLALGAGEPEFDYLTFHQSPHLGYLTGFDEPDAALVMVKHGAQVEEMLFVQDRDPSREVWTGVRLGVAAVRARMGIDGRDAATLESVLDSLLTLHPVLNVAGDIGTRGFRVSHHDQFVAAVLASHPAVELTDVRREVDRLRGHKSEAELDRLRIAAEISARGHLAAWQTVAPGVAEFEMQAAAEYTWRREGGDGPSYGTIVGSGPNSTVLHYNRDDRVAQAGEVVVMDMATFFDGYSADITRTVPVSGRFSPEQRAIYAIVLDAQKAAERQVRVDGPSRAMSDSATAVLSAGLAAIGLIEAPGATYDCGTVEKPRACSQLSLFYMHGLGHGIGLAVHDPDQYSATGHIGVGSAFTIEPGIYVRRNLLDILPDTPRNQKLKARIAGAVARYADIGVRIEDDYLVTDRGVIRPTAGVPREIDEIERELAKPRLPRDASVVERYLRYKTGR
jgi:Xaa-Pro aminopeptidase